jgi:hypothetical protein
VQGNINKVITWLEQQTDSERLNLLHLLIIKKYVLNGAVINTDEVLF